MGEGEDLLKERYQALLESHAELVRSRDAAMESKTAVERSLDACRSQVTDVRKHLIERELEVKQRESALAEMSAQLEDSNEKLRRVTQEKTRFRSELTLQGEQLSATEKQLREARETAAALQAEQLPTQYELTKLQYDVGALSAKASYAEGELSRKTAALEELQASSAKASAEAEQRLRTAAMESKTLADKHEFSERRAGAAEAKVAQMQQALSDSEHRLLEERDKAKFNAAAQEKVIDMYKTHFHEASQRALEYERTMALLREEKEGLSAQVIELKAKEGVSASPNAIAARVGGDSHSPTHHRIAPDNENEDDNQGYSPVPEDLKGLSTIDVYNKYRELLAELRQSRDDLNVFHASTPATAALRHDYLRLLESHKQLTSRLDDLRGQLTTSREEAIAAKTACESALARNKVLDRLNIDLGMQLQHLLKAGHDRMLELEGVHEQLMLTDGRPYSHSQTHKPRYLEESVGPAQLVAVRDEPAAQAVITANLVVVDNIADLQNQNAQLLQVVRKLAGDCDAQQMVAGSRADAAALSAALEELKAVRESRTRTESLVMELAQQRDTYKRLLDEAESLAGAAARAVRNKSDDEEGSLFAQSERWRKEAECANVERGELEEKIMSLESAARAQEEQLRSRERDALSTLAVKTAEVSRLEAAREALVADRDHLALQLHNEINNRSTMQGLLDAEKDARVATEQQARRSADEAKRVREDARLAHLEAQTSQERERNSLDQLAQARRELAQMSVLKDSFGRIEARLEKHDEAEAVRVTAERDAAVREAETLRTAIQDKMLLASQEVMRLGEDLRVAEARADDLVVDALTAKEALQREKSSTVAAEKRAGVLEHQLLIAHQRLSALQGLDIASTAAAIEADAHAREAALAKALFQVESLKGQLASADEHVQMFRSISESAEEKLAALERDSDQRRAEWHVQMVELKSDLDNANAVARSGAEKLHELLGERMHEEERIAAAEAAAQNECSSLRAEVTIWKEKLSAAQSEVERLTYQQDTVAMQAAEARAEKEALVRSQAAAMESLRQVEADKDALSVKLLELEETAGATAAQQVAECQAERAQVAALQTKLEEVVCQRDDLRRMSDLLQGQVQSLASQVERSSVSTGVLASAVGSGVTGAAVSDEVTDIVAELQRSNADLREVQRLMRRDRDTLEAKVILMESEVARIKASTGGVHRALEETKAELQREMERNSSAKGSSEFAQIMVEVTQLGLVRESNARLKGEVERLMSEVQDLQGEAAGLRSSTAPLRERVKELEGIVEDGRVAQVAAQRDAALWKDRLEALLGRYSDVDPKEYRAMQDRVAEAMRDLASTKQALETLRAEKTEVETRLENDNKVLTKSKEFSDSQVDKFRTKLRNLKTGYEAEKAKHDESEGINSELRSKLAAAESKASAATLALAKLKSRLAAEDGKKKTSGGDTGDTSSASLVAPMSDDLSCSVVGVTPVAQEDVSESLSALREAALKNKKLRSRAGSGGSSKPIGGSSLAETEDDDKTENEFALSNEIAAPVTASFPSSAGENKSSTSRGVASLNPQATSFIPGGTPFGNPFSSSSSSASSEFGVFSAVMPRKRAAQGEDWSGTDTGAGIRDSEPFGGIAKQARGLGGAVRSTFNPFKIVGDAGGSGVSVFGNDPLGGTSKERETPSLSRKDAPTNMSSGPGVGVLEVSEDDDNDNEGGGLTGDATESSTDKRDRDQGDEQNEDEDDAEEDEGDEDDNEEEDDSSDGSDGSANIAVDNDDDDDDYENAGDDEHEGVMNDEDGDEGA